jgi:hypothetical protein
MGFGRAISSGRPLISIFFSSCGHPQKWPLPTAYGSWIGLDTAFPAFGFPAASDGRQEIRENLPRDEADILYFSKRVRWVFA